MRFYKNTDIYNIVKNPEKHDSQLYYPKKWHQGFNMFQIMIFLFFFFVGVIGVIWYHNRILLRQLNDLSDEHAQLRVLLRALESRLDGILALEKINSEKDSGKMECREREIPAGQDPLLHLSFDKKPDLPPGELDENSPLKM